LFLARQESDPALAVNLLGDALRDTFDVREQGVDR
jgi:hypothetical protein